MTTPVDGSYFKDGKRWYPVPIPAEIKQEQEATYADLAAALIERGRAEERAALAAHLRAEIARWDAIPSMTGQTLFPTQAAYRAAVVDTLTWLEARSSE